MLVVETDRGWRVDDLHYGTTRTYRTLPRATAAIHRAAAVLTESGVAGVVITAINYVAYSEDGLAQLATVKTSHAE